MKNNLNNVTSLDQTLVGILKPHPHYRNFFSNNRNFSSNKLKLLKQVKTAPQKRRVRYRQPFITKASRLLMWRSVVTHKFLLWGQSWCPNAPVCDAKHYLPNVVFAFQVSDGSGDGNKLFPSPLIQSVFQSFRQLSVHQLNRSPSVMDWWTAHHCIYANFVYE